MGVKSDDFSRHMDGWSDYIFFRNVDIYAIHALFNNLFNSDLEGMNARPESLSYAP